MIINAFAGNVITLDQDYDSNPIAAIASNSLNITQLLRASPIYTNTFSFISLKQEHLVRTSIYQQMLSSYIELHHHGAPTKIGEASSILGLLHHTKQVEYEILLHNLVLSHLAESHKWRENEAELNITNTVSANMVRNRELTNTLNLTSTTTGYKADDKFIATEEIELTRPDHIELTFGATTINLRNPEFGNTNRLEVTKINRKTRGGDLVAFRDPQWPLNEILRYTFSGLKESEATSLLNFFKISLGKQITLVDFEGRTWEGIILTPADEVLQRGRFTFNASFEFLGTWIS